MPYAIFLIDKARNNRCLVTYPLSNAAVRLENKAQVESFAMTFDISERPRIVACLIVGGEMSDKHYLPLTQWCPCDKYGKPIKVEPTLSQSLRRAGMTEAMAALLKGETEPFTESDFAAFADAEPGSRKWEKELDDAWSMFVIYDPYYATTCTPEGTPTWEWEVYFNHPSLDQPFCERYAIPFTAVETTTLM